MKSELFYKYITVCFDRLEKSHGEYLQVPDNKCLFRFRVEIKKIRACLKCIESYQGKKEFKKPRAQFRKIFSKAGCLRELKIYLSWFRRHHLMRVAKLIHLEGEINKKHCQFTGASAMIKDTVKDNRKLILNKAKHISQEQVFKFYLQMLRERLELLQKELVKGKWHKIRKQFKLVLYARHWQDEKGLKVLSKTQALFLDQLQHIIGDWHDNEIMMNWLKNEQEKAGNKTGKDPSNSKKTKAGTTEREKDALAFEKAIKLMEEARIVLEARVIKKSKLSDKVLKTL